MSRFLVFLFSCALLSISGTWAGAEPQIGLKGLGGHIGYISPENIDATFGLGGHVDLGTLADNLHLEGNLDYWGESKSYGYFGNSWKVKTHDIAFGGCAKYYMDESNGKVRLYGGGGLALHHVSAKVEDVTGVYGPLGSASASTNKIGLDLVGGALFGHSETMKFMGEARYRAVSDYGQFCLFGGITFYLHG